MARPGETKIFGGTAVPAGKYVISRAFVGKAKLEIEGKDPKEYETLEVELLNLQNGQPSNQVLLTTFKLNGCWRPRFDKEGKKLDHKGTFRDQLMAGFLGKSFATTADGITQHFRGYELSITYEEYPSSTGVGHVWKADLGQKHVLPALQQPQPAVQQPAADVQQPAAAVPPAATSLPF